MKLRYVINDLMWVSFFYFGLGDPNLNIERVAI